MRISEIVLAGVADIHDVCDAQCLNNVGITRVMVVA